MEGSVKNIMEDIVRAKMPEVLASMPDICNCELCRLDRLAYALNNCPPRYAVTTKGEIFSRLKEMEKQFNTDLVRIITDAAIVVGKSPRCK